uniref:Ty3/Gypsy family RNase HI domain-containing protein n=1 Tax=Bradyrhizobium sp. TM233 TaxID=2599801 RepID=UPI0030C77007
QAFKIIETDASDIGLGGILKQKVFDKEQIIAFTSKHWNPAQQNYSTVKKEVLAIVLSISKFQSDLINQKFLVRVDCKSAKEILQKDVKNLASKHIFARWQAILSVFDFDIEYIKGSNNFPPDFLTREYLQGRT